MNTTDFPINLPTGCENLGELLISTDFIKGLELVLSLSNISDNDIKKICDIFINGLSYSSEDELKFVLQILQIPLVQANSKTFLRRLGLNNEKITDFIKGFRKTGYEQVVDRVRLNINNFIEDLGSGEIKKSFNNGIVILEEGVAKIDIETGKLLFAQRNLGIGEIKEFIDDRGLGTTGVAKIDIKTGELLFAQRDLGIGEIKKFLYDGKIIGTTGVAEINMESGKILFTTGDLGIGEIRSFDNYGKIIGTTGFVEIDPVSYKILINTGDLGIGEIKHIDYDGKIKGTKGVAIMNTSTREVYTTGDLGIGKIKHLYIIHTKSGFDILVINGTKSDLKIEDIDTLIKII